MIKSFDSLFHLDASLGSLVEKTERYPALEKHSAEPTWRTTKSKFEISIEKKNNKLIDSLSTERETSLKAANESLLTQHNPRPRSKKWREKLLIATRAGY